MPKAVLRPLIGGGISKCNSPEHLVGHRRCKHTSGESFEQKINEFGFTCVEIKSINSNNGDVSNSSSNRKELDNYVLSLKGKISDEKRVKILEFFRAN